MSSSSAYFSSSSSSSTTSDQKGQQVILGCTVFFSNLGETSDRVGGDGSSKNNNTREEYELVLLEFQDDMKNKNNWKKTIQISKTVAIYEGENDDKKLLEKKITEQKRLSIGSFRKMIEQLYEHNRTLEKATEDFPANVIANLGLTSGYLMGDSLPTNDEEKNLNRQLFKNFTAKPASHRRPLRPRLLMTELVTYQNPSSKMKEKDEYMMIVQPSQNCGNTHTDPQTWFIHTLIINRVSLSTGKKLPLNNITFTDNVYRAFINEVSNPSGLLGRMLPISFGRDQKSSINYQHDDADEDSSNENKNDGGVYENYMNFMYALQAIYNKISACRRLTSSEKNHLLISRNITSTCDDFERTVHSLQFQNFLLLLLRT